MRSQPIVLMLRLFCSVVVVFVVVVDVSIVFIDFIAKLSSNFNLQL